MQPSSSDTCVLQAPRRSGTGPTATVYVVDDDVSVREALEGLIQVSGWRARTFACAADFLDSAPDAGPSCLVLDVGLPDLNGLDLQDRIGSQLVGMPIIFITGYGDVPMTVRAMKAGAAEFLTKPFGDEVLLAAIDDALQRSQAVLAEQTALQALRDRRAGLSRRECEVMDLVVTGLLNKQVGGELGISEITVKAHRGRVMEKMQARSLADLVRMSQRLGLHPED
ncbi:response regulator [uncultured Phenylobacterium sp.]|uniref:response regulator transcription factor n=1 Tax=uncultured Phenylobacterium sp. TaxID=349273 RepID=UPI0025CF2041|nr:response regulator [uncultured Phenylobacterium sp.]